MKPKYPELCSYGATCPVQDCEEFLGYYVSQRNADNAVETHRKVHGHSKPKPKAKPGPKPRKYMYYKMTCPCGWSYEAKEELLVHAEFAEHLKESSSCLDTARNASMTKEKK